MWSAARVKHFYIKGPKVPRNPWRGTLRGRGKERRRKCLTWRTASVIILVDKKTNREGIYGIQFTPNKSSRVSKGIG